MDCIVCAFPFDLTERLFTYGACGHSDVCSICFLKMRALQRNFQCPTCKSVLDTVVCSAKSDVTYASFSIWGESAGPDHTLDHKSQMFFPRDYFRHKVETLWACKCKICGQVKRDIKGLRAHVHGDHNLQMCQLCLDNRQSFPGEHMYYSSGDYETHLRCGGDDGSEGHPFCEFCRKRFYDKSALFVHLSKDHYGCHICIRQGIQYTYYKDYGALGDHFRTAHFVCEDPICLAKRFVVFPNSIDLASHTMQNHPSAQISRSIPIHFKVKRSTDSSKESAEGGEKEGGSDVRRNRFEGGLGGRAANGEWQVELAYQAVDPRDSTRSTGGAVDYSATSAAIDVAEVEEEFPSLPGESRSSRRHQGWAHGSTAAVGKTSAAGSRKAAHHRDFPTLGISGGKKWADKAGGVSRVGGAGESASSSLRNHTGQYVQGSKRGEISGPVSVIAKRPEAPKQGGPTPTLTPPPVPPAPLPSKADFPIPDSSSGKSPPAPALSQGGNGKPAAKAKKTAAQTAGNNAGSLAAALKEVGLAPAAGKAKKKTSGISIVKTTASIPKSKSSSSLASDDGSGGESPVTGSRVADWSLQGLQQIGRRQRDVAGGGAAGTLQQPSVGKPPAALLPGQEREPPHSTPAPPPPFFSFPPGLGPNTGGNGQIRQAIPPELMPPPLPPGLAQQFASEPPPGLSLQRAATSEKPVSSLPTRGGWVSIGGATETRKQLAEVAAGKKSELLETEYPSLLSTKPKSGKSKNSN